MYPLICNLKKPIIYWYQNDGEIVMRVMLHDVEDYFLRVKTDEFEFSTTLDGVDYYVYIHLFGAVIAEETSHVTTGREVTVRLSKVQKWTSWPRLFYSSHKLPQIFIDVDRLESCKSNLQSRSAWDERQDFATFKKKNQIVQIMPDVPSSNEDDSEDECYNELFE